MVVAQHPLLQLARVSGRDAQGTDARPLGAIHNVSVTFDAGVHAFVGRPADGTVALCELIAGRRSPTVGVVSILGREPKRSASTRSRIAVSLPHPSLHGPSSVAEWLAVVSAARGVDLTGCLHDFHIEQLGSRSVRSLDEAEARAVEVAALLSVPELAVVALFEPGAIAPLELDLLHERLRGLADLGACVVIATGAPEDLGSLPDHVYLLEGGKLWGRDEEIGWAPRAVDPDHEVGIRGIAESVSIWLAETGARRLASQLNARSEVTAVRWGAADGAAPAARTSLHERLAEVVVSGPVLESVALAVASAVDDLGLEVVAMHHIPLGIEGMRAAARAHRAALEDRAQPAPTITSSTPRPPEGA